MPPSQPIQPVAPEQNRQRGIFGAWGLRMADRLGMGRSRMQNQGLQINLLRPKRRVGFLERLLSGGSKITGHSAIQRESEPHLADDTIDANPGIGQPGLTDEACESEIQKISPAVFRTMKRLLNKDHLSTVAGLASAIKVDITKREDLDSNIKIDLINYLDRLIMSIQTTESLPVARETDYTASVVELPTRPTQPANPERPTLDKAKASIEGGYLYRAPSELVSIINNTESTAEDKLAAKTLLDQVELVLRTKEEFDRLVRMRQAPEGGDSQPSNQDIIAAKRSAIEALTKLYPYNGEEGEAFQIRRDYLHARATPYESAADTGAIAPVLGRGQPEPAAATDPEMQRKIAEVERTKKALEDLLLARQQADETVLDVPDHLSNLAILRARSAAMLALVQLYPTGIGYDDAMREKYEAAKKEIWDMTEPYVTLPTPPARAAPALLEPNPMTPQELKVRRNALLEEMGPAEATYRNERRGPIRNKQKLIETAKELYRIYKEYSEIAAKLGIADIANIYQRRVEKLEQELTELNKPSLGRRGLLALTGMRIKTKDIATKALDYVNNGIVDDVSKLRNDPRASLKELGDRALVTAKKLTEYGIKGLDKFDKLGPKGKTYAGIAALILSVPTAGLSSALLKTVSTAAFSRRSYQKMMQKNLEEFAYNQFVESKRDDFENVTIPRWKKQAQDEGRNFDPISLEKYIALNLVDGGDPKYTDFQQKLIKEKEAFVSEIKMPDFEADPSYKDKQYRAVEISIAKGLLLGVTVPTILSDIMDSETFGLIKDKVGEYMPGAVKDSARQVAKVVGERATPVVEAASKAARVATAASSPSPDASAPTAGAGTTGAGTGATTSAPAAPTATVAQAPAAQAPAPAAPAAPVAQAPTVMAASPALSTNFPISLGDNLETLMKNNLPILDDLTPQQQENVIYNFLERSTGKEWMERNGITNMNRIFTGNKIDLQSLSDAIEKTKITNNRGVIQTLIERARDL